MSFVYTIGIPNPPNNPSTDVPKMQTNTNSIYSLINVDHVPFNTTNGGKHKQVQVQQVASLPIGLVSGFNTIYSKAANPGAKGQLFFSQGTDGNEVQLTAAFTGSVPTNASNGASFLPGGLLIQWGSAAAVSGGTTVNFTRSFSAPPYSITATSIVQSAAATVTSLTASNFVLRAGAGGPATTFWIAIGPA